MAKASSKKALTVAGKTCQKSQHISILQTGVTVKRHCQYPVLKKLSVKRSCLPPPTFSIVPIHSSHGDFP
jgi:hypothetical protein